MKESFVDSFKSYCIPIVFYATTDQLTPQLGEAHGFQHLQLERPTHSVVRFLYIHLNYKIATPSLLVDVMSELHC